MRQSSRITFRSTFRIKISDRERDTLIGYAGDVSECGMKLLSDALVEPGSTLKLRVRMRDREGNLRQVDVDMVCQWSQENTRTGFFEAGMALQGESAEYVRLIEGMRKLRKEKA
ncbi:MULTISPECIES: PilZ domain-containing protein [Pseudomonadaceae]|uniref:PilZ domain-containing protein n=1 Tax=Ectopseudomonas khazarica TaxID=2502979 RepID=A0ABW7MHL3_9GAMM|nr:MULTISPECIES: PilZ domain-containing protein [Pseudomonas]WFC64658.1 PilZ domain-containing protein [Pseudomonas sp. REST10]|tara:strand:- start:129 stop:470 length:342 start_codon:yes stop_codon:yes gene_type:complete